MDITREFAAHMDQSDPLSSFRDRFHMPILDGKECLYFTGNSLGLQPKSARAALEQEMLDWELHGVEGHFEGKNPWFHYHKFLTDDTAYLVGAKPIEVVVMNNLTVNLHFMMVSFYRPSGSRYKILMEAGAFPSDMYAVESQVRFHGYAYEDAVIEVKPRPGEFHLRHEDIIQTIEDHAGEIALVLFSGVQYYTGQAFNIPDITRAAHAAGAFCGFDLAHAAGNIELKLHDWDVDFAVWCSYKYLNSGPGGVSGVFVHERFAEQPDIPRFAGWWGHREMDRFEMKKGFIPEPGAAGWQLSNAPVLSMAVHRASLKIFREAGLQNIYEKGKQLNAYLNFILQESNLANDELEFNIITPADRGCQISVLTGENGHDLFEYLTANRVIVDWREPNVIRLAPVPLYNSYTDICRLGELLRGFSEETI